jgi:hypothetical protein
MDDMELYGEEEFDLAEYVHDQDSFWPMNPDEWGMEPDDDDDI